MAEFSINEELLLCFGFIAIPMVALHLLFRLRPGALGRFLDRVSKWLSSRLNFPKKWVARDVTTIAEMWELDFQALASRFKFTLLTFFINIYTYVFTTDFRGEITHDTLEKLGFSYANFAHHKWFILITSNFIHFNLSHLGVNMLMLVFFTGTLELLLGSSFAGVIYITAMNSNIPNGIFLLPTLRYFYPNLWNDTIYYVDVGASLGIVGTLGGLARILIPKIRRTLLWTAVLGTLASALYLKTLFGLDHAFSALMGYGMAAYLLKNRAKKHAVLIEMHDHQASVPKLAKTGSDS